MIIKNPTMTAAEATARMRDAGFRISVPSLIAGIEQGKYPFGIVINMQKRVVEIYTLDLERWLRSKTVADDGEEVGA